MTMIDDDITDLSLNIQSSPPEPKTAENNVSKLE